MRVVNLSRRPFINRRPIVRIAALLWLFGAVVLAINVRLYTGHWLGSAENRRLLAEVRQELTREQQVLSEKSQKFQRLSLDRRNRRAAFLNQLIDARTFPWSGLFDDLEEVLPEGVRLVAVRPDVKLASGRRTRAEVERASGGGGEADELAQDEVELRLNGIAQSFDQLDEFVDRLFNHPFREPNLSNATFDPNQGAGATVFSLGVIYRTRREPLVSPVEPELAEGAAEELDEAADPADPEALSARRADGGRASESQPTTEEEVAAAEGSLEFSDAPPASAQASPDAESGSPAGRQAAAPSSRPTASGAPRTAQTRPDPSGARPDQPPPSRARPDQPSPGQPGSGQPRTGFAGLPTPPPVAEATPPNTPRPSAQQTPPRQTPPPPSETRPRRPPPPPPPPPRDRPADPSEGRQPSFGDRDASSSAAFLAEPVRVLASMPPEAQRSSGDAAGGAKL